MLSSIYWMCQLWGVCISSVIFFMCGFWCSFLAGCFSFLSSLWFLAWGQGSHSARPSESWPSCHHRRGRGWSYLQLIFWLFRIWTRGRCSGKRSSHQNAEQCSRSSCGGWSWRQPGGSRPGPPLQRPPGPLSYWCNTNQISPSAWIFFVLIWLIHSSSH